MSKPSLMFSDGSRIDFESPEAANAWVDQNMSFLTGAVQATDIRRTRACVNACKGISTDRLEKMVPGTLANLLTLKGAE